MVSGQLSLRSLKKNAVQFNCHLRQLITLPHPVTPLTKVQNILKRAFLKKVHTTQKRSLRQKVHITQKRVLRKKVRNTKY